jgi:hypothetical protein
MTAIRQRTVGWALAALTAPTLVSCGPDTPAVCEQAEELRTAVQNVKDVNVSENGLAALTSTLDQVMVEFEQFRTEAGNQFKPQIDAVKVAADQVRVSLADARAEPTAATLGAVRTSLGALQTAGQGLRDTVAATC